MKVKSPSKLNLHLEVIRKRIDGYHDIRSAIQLIDFYDEMEFKIIKKNIVLNDQLKVKDNIVLKAASLMSRFLKKPKGVEIELKKNIPMGGGMGGGSSNAATTLLVLNKIWEINLSLAELQRIAISIGSDVPIFVSCNNSWVEGKGEILEQIKLEKKWFLLFFPKINISTKEAFTKLSYFPEDPISKEQFIEGKSLNSFTKQILRENKEIKLLFEKLKEYGSPKLTGTGSTIYLDFSNLAEAQNTKNKIKEGLLTKSIEHSPLKVLIE
tara:strand:+ start:556 stop:1359 length:804 start_codon:yes stop_codon:yes gene_type:complete